MTITTNEINEAITALGLADQPLCIHSSFRSFGDTVEGGPETVANAFLDKGCTVMVPAFLYESIKPPHGRNPQHNGMEDDYEGNPQQDAIHYSPDLNVIDQKEMGAFPAALLHMSGRVRGSHPICSFAALGPMADELISTQTPATMLAPLQKLVEIDGYILMMGIGLDRMTLIHLAETNAGRSLFYRWARDKDGAVIETRTSGCSLGFTNLVDVLLPLCEETTVGHSLWRLFKASEVLQAAEQAIRANPMITHCGRKNCLRCDDAAAGGPD
ncbi:AAC(3) family N-acetyltransferase [Planctomycetota bacterium]